ncbi:MAG TPA: POTRA domain-containing protein [Candidatus Acidoferrales bacterium]|nr:POTRA domain-containing protein [Candidatus Acidoferrales bacterium]
MFIDAVRFEGTTDFPDSLRQELISGLLQKRFMASEDWRREVENTVRSAWQDQGFFTVTVDPEFQLLSGDEKQQHYSAFIRIDEGLQYRLGELHIINSNPKDNLAPFPPEILREQVPLQRGDLFSVEKIRQGLEALARLYGTRGYIDSTSNLVSDVDQERRVVSLTIEVDAGVQFKLKNLEITGANPGMESQLRSFLKSGEALDTGALREFVKNNAEKLPPDVWRRRFLFLREPTAGTVDLKIDLRPCLTSEN